MKAESRAGSAGTPAGGSAQWVRQTRSEQTRGRPALFQGTGASDQFTPASEAFAARGGYNRRHCPGGETGRRKGLKIPRCASAVPVRPRLPAPRDLMLRDEGGLPSASAERSSNTPPVTSRSAQQLCCTASASEDRPRPSPSSRFTESRRRIDDRGGISAHRARVGAHHVPVARAVNFKAIVLHMSLRNVALAANPSENKAQAPWLKPPFPPSPRRKA